MRMSQGMLWLLARMCMASSHARMDARSSAAFPPRCLPAHGLEMRASRHRPAQIFAQLAAIADADVIATGLD